MTLHERLEDVFQRVFADDLLALTDATTAADIEDWDSVAHINLMFSIEETFGVEFRENEFASLESVGNLKRVLQAKGVA